MNKRKCKTFFLKVRFLFLMTISTDYYGCLRICAFGIVKVCYKEQKARGWPAKVKCEKQKIEKRSRLSSNFRLLTHQQATSSEKDKLTNEYVSNCSEGTF